jgi:glycine/D-amino acid oxidase-like deaminating enzyme
VTNPDLHLGTLAQLLRTEPRVEVAPHFPGDALARLTLDEPGAVFISPPDDRYVFGIYDEERRSLALVDGEHLLIHGEDAAADRLRRWAAHVQPLEQSVQIVALPFDRAREDREARAIVRQHYAFMIRPK